MQQDGCNNPNLNLNRHAPHILHKCSLQILQMQKDPGYCSYSSRSCCYSSQKGKAAAQHLTYLHQVTLACSAGQTVLITASAAASMAARSAAGAAEPKNQSSWLLCFLNILLAVHMYISPRLTGSCNCKFKICANVDLVAWHSFQIL